MTSVPGLFQRDIRESDEADYSDLEEGSLERVGLLSFNQAAVAIQGVPIIEENADHSKCHSSSLVSLDADEVML